MLFTIAAISTVGVITYAILLYFDLRVVWLEEEQEKERKQAEKETKEQEKQKREKWDEEMKRNSGGE